MTGSDGPVTVVAADARVGDLLEDLAAALHGGRPLLPLPPGEPGVAARRAAALDEPVDPGAALLLATSGSSGAPKVVELSGRALRASADGAAAALGGPAQWLLALPLVHVAGWQVLVRSVLAGTDPVALSRGPFSPAAFAAAAAGMTGGRRCTALVPTQLRRVLSDPAAREAAATLDAGLVGGAATPASLLDAAGAAGVRVVTTYGSTETSGGCVYDGAPLSGVRVGLVDGGVGLSGDVLATRYRGAPALTAETFVTRGDHRWYLTPDVGRFVTADAGSGPRLVVDGRRDDVVITGGVNVSPVAVERVLVTVGGVAEVLVVGVPSPEWGQELVALVVPDGRAPDLAALRRAVTARLGAAHAPRSLLLVEALPATPLGKPDRRAAAAAASTHDRADGPR